MKKFLSLLLALTLVLSLVVVPARAHGDTLRGVSLSSNNLTLEVGASTGNELTVSASSLTYGTSATAVPDDATAAYVWSSSDSTVATVQAKDDSTNKNVGVIRALKKSTSPITISCAVTYTWNATTEPQRAAGSATTTLNCTLTVNNTAGDAADAAFKTAITAITYNGRNYLSSGRVTAYKFDGDTDDNAWNATAQDYTNIHATFNSGSSKITVTATKDSSTVTAEFPCTLTNATATVEAKPATISKLGESKLSVTLSAGTPTSYAWSYKEKNTSGEGTSLGTSSTASLKGVTAGKTYTVTCVASYKISDSITKTVTGTKDVVVEDTTYAFGGSAIIYANKNEPKYVDAKLYPVGSSTAVNDATYTYTVSPSTSNIVTVASDGRITIQNSGIAYVTVTSDYKGVKYTYSVTIYASALSADLSRQVYYGNPVTYSYSDFIEAANKALSGSYGYGSYYGTVTTIVSASAPVSLSNLGTFTGSISNNSGYIYATASYSGRGKAPITATVKTSTGQPVTVTLNIPVVPIPTTFDSLTAEPITTNYTTSINNYRITFPSTYSTYYVVQKNGTTAPDYATASLVGNAYSSSTPYTLTSTDFTNGQCTLYVIATNNYTYGSSYGTYYSGAITVTQTNHDIKYNGVVGGTVQFKHNDFTTFMNEMYGTNTTSYLTFNSVKFTSVPNATSQGTLYYNGVAMTTGYGSNYFNTSTAVTNLDNVSFSVSSKVPSTTKEIRIPFTLYATRYNSYGTSAGTSVTYSGVVVISLVREDVTFTVAPGDSVRFTDSAFLTYLRSASGINYNYNIDYVTFDQSAVNALNEGVLYAYSTGFNAVKTTDRFYYTTTSYNQNALSDVTFRASTYAKTGTTVYIPFTITAKYGTSSATRQVTGTVAIKIAQTMNFVDVKTSDYFYDSVKWAVTKNITKGTSATTFSPNNTCSRAEIVTFLWRAAGSPTPTITRNPFTDVKYSVGSDFYNAILWASQNGIAAGTSTTTFAPNDNCTRAQIVTFLWRYAKKPLGYYTNPFNDVNKTEYAAYYDAILWAAGKGIATGNTPKTFNPDGTCTRAEAVTFLYRYESTK